ncbi:hypothetical protein BKA67DRAFT_645999 [Truncatella angustata]|uniref:Uncharacterized protein n=1 Tax=Truncatella angustata TaxID=152316 RepID=A0A9P8ZYP9_9PEZI|nr:uncharacterized protein BKA67DRAFT_645999 [Truncatella angustata]KAH6654245.1 hypothetical protein BKA67DRAFT_645999 [Truncatella angustata]
MTGKAKEIEEIPMCANCAIGTEDDDQDTVVQKALRRIDIADGGLSRNRWERGNDKTTIAGTRKFRRASSKVTRHNGEATALPAPLAHGSSRLATDGAIDHSEDGGYCAVPLDSTIYVDVNDPTGLPAFKPSPTKPIPQRMQPPWMKTLPNQHKPSRVVNSRPQSILDNHFSDVFSVLASRSLPSEPETVCPTAINSPSRVLSPRKQQRELERDTEYFLSKAGHDDVEDLRSSPVIVPRGPNISFVTSEPLKRPSSRVVGSKLTRKDSLPMVSGQYRNPSPYPVPPRSSSATPMIPSISASPPQSIGEGDESASLFQTSVDKKSPSPLSTAIAHMKSKIHRIPPPQSTEYLEFYKPTQSASASIHRPTVSIAVAGRAKGRRVGNWEKPQPVVEITRRDIDLDQPRKQA